MKTAPRFETGLTLRFTSTLSDGTVALPDDVRRDLPAGEGVVEGTMSGFPFRAPYADGRIRVSDALEKAIGGKPGAALTVELTRFGDEPEVRIPDDFLAALESTPKIKAAYEDVTPMARREWVRWIASAKQEATRQKRIEVGMDKLSKGMRRPCCFPGLNFVTKDLVPPEDTWLALPGAKGSKEE